MNKKALIISCCIVVILLIVTFCMMSLSSNEKYDYKNESRMFESVDDFAFLDEFVIEENLNLDKDILNAPHADFSEHKTITIEYNGKKINVFAYEFKNTHCCVEYANKASGNNYKTLDLDKNISRYYYKHTSFFNIFQSEKLLVFSNEKAYVISAKISEKEFNEFIKYFMSQLPTKMEMTY